MSTTIDSLDIQITTSAGSSAKKIDELAAALGRLRTNSKLTSVANNLTKLKTALDGLNNSSGAISRLKSLSAAMQGLSTIPKMSNFTSTVNGLKKIPDIIKDLDAQKIDLFRRKMEELAKALDPLATKITAVGNGFAKLPNKVGGTVTAVNRLTRANTNLNNTWEGGSVGLFATIQNYETLFQVLNNVATAMADVISQAMEWDGIEARFGRVFGEDAEETYKYLQKVNDALGLNIQEMMQYSSMYGSLLSGFGLSQDKVTTISVGLTELTYDLWAANNDVVKRYEDVATAVKSAITGEIEPIRNLGIAMTEASLQEFIDSTNLAGMSIEKMTEAQKSEVRYAAMVNSALNQGIVGTYAREMNTAEGAVRSLSQSFKGLVQAFGSLFIPLLQTIVPYITAFVEILTDAVFWLAELVGIPIQRINFGDSGVKAIADDAKAATDGLDSAADAAKKLKNYTMGFDELNVIDPNSGSKKKNSGGTENWGTGLDLDTLWDDAIFAQAGKQVDELKQKVKEYIDEHKILLSVVGSVAAFFGFMKALRGLDALFGVSKTVKNLGTAFGALKKVVYKALPDAAKAMVSDVGWFAAMFPKTATILSTASAWVTGTLLPTIKSAFLKIPSVLVNAVKAIPGWGWVAAAVIALITGAITLALTDKDFTDIGYKIGHALGNALKKVGEWLGAAGEWIVSVGKSILGGIEAAWRWVIKEFDIDNIFELILIMFNPVAWVKKIIPKMIEIGKEVLPGLWEGIKAGWNNFWGNIEEFIDGFIQGFKDGLGISSPSKVFAEIGEWIVQGLLNGISSRWEAVRGWFRTTVAPKFTKEYWVGIFNSVTSATKSKLEEAKKIMDEKWGSVTSWFNKTVAPKFTKDYWQSKYETIVAATKNKLEEVKKLISEKWSGITGWFDKNVAPKFTKDYWLVKFSGLKDGLVQTMKNAVNGAVDILNKFIGWINSHLKFSWDGLEIAGKEVYPGGSIQLFTIPTIAKFEKGGFIEDGLFTMNRGEIAGKFSNGKSVVANNEQIISGIAEGVYSAVVAAMNDVKSNGGEQNVNVYLDGKQIYASVKRTEARRGANLMGNQLGYVY